MKSKEIKIFQKNSDNKGKKLLVIGVFHGDEPQGEYFINSHLKNSKMPIKNSLYYIPRLNFNNKRKNDNGVDLNRNFPTKNWELGEKGSDYFGGNNPNSEVETQFIVDLIDKVKFDAIITIHSPYKVINYDGPAEKIANEISKILNYPTKADIGYPTPGSFGTYSGVERQIPTITIEIDEEENLEKLNSKFSKLFNWLEDEY